MTRRRFATALVVLAATAAGAQQPAEPRLQYQLDAGTKHVRGASREVEWSVLALDDGAFALHLVVPVVSLVSDDAQFDAALWNASRAAGVPFLEVTGVARDGRFEGKLRIAGSEEPLSLSLRTSRVDGALVATVSAVVDPSRFGLPVHGPADLRATLRIAASPNAVLVGGTTHASN